MGAGARKPDRTIKEPERDLGQGIRWISDVEAETSRYFSPTVKEHGRAATAVRLPGVRALPNASILTRSMRPLARKRATWNEASLDEEATVTAFVETGLFTPLYSPGRGKWFDLALVVEDTASMHLWRNVIGEFESLMRHLGAFRRVTRWSIAYRDDRLWLTSGTRLTHGSAELVNRKGRQLVLLMSDCASPAWYGKAMFRFCDELGRVAPIAVLQMLPRRHWAATGLGAVEVGLGATFPGTSNRWLSVARPWWLRQESPAESVPMPVGTLEPAELREWARLMMGAGGGLVKGVLLYAGDASVARPPAGNSATARDRINGFRAMVTANAYALAGVFAAASPLTVPIMQLLHRTLFDGNDLVPLAEVFLGQLLKRATPTSETLPFDEIAYDFDPEVRDLLLENVDRMQALVMLQTVGDYLECTTGSATDFRALLADAAGALHIDEAARPFAEVVRRVRDRFDVAPRSRGSREIEFARGLSVRAEVEIDAPVRHFAFPGSLASFIGRVQEQQALRNLLQSTRLLTITGPPGIGKTRLAVEVARSLLVAFDFVWLVELSRLAEEDLVPQRVALVLGLREQVLRPPLEALAEFVGRGQTLLVLNDCDHLIKGCANLAEYLLHRCPQLKILIDSRTILMVAGEHSYVVPPLGTPDPERLPPLGELSLIDSVKLFLERASHADRNFRLTDQNARAVATLCRELEGIPLSIELAAAWLSTMSVDQLLALSNHQLEVLVGGVRRKEKGWVAAKEAVRFSYDLLENEQRALFRKLSVFRGGWTLEAATAICGEGQQDMSKILLLLSQLHRMSLLVVEEANGQKRFRMLNAIREYAQGKMADAEEERAVAEQHAKWYLKFAEERASVLREGGDQDRVLEEIELEHDNLLNALDWCTAKSDWEPALRLGAALWRFWENRPLSEGRKHLKQLIDTVEKLGPGFVTSETPETVAALGRVYSAAGVLAYRRGDAEDAMVLFKRAFEIEEKRGDRKRIANCLNDLGLAAQATGNLQGALKYYRDYLVMARNIGAKREIAIGLYNVGNTEMRLGHSEDARPSLAESRKLFKELFNSDIAYPMTALGWLAVFDNDGATAEDLFAESFKEREQFMHKRGMVDCWNGLGRAAILRDDFEEARRRLTAGLNTARELGADKAIAQIIESFAILAVCENEMVKALTLSSAARALREKIQSPRTPAFARDQEQWMEKAKGALAADKSAGALDAGVAMKLDDIINMVCPNLSSL
jgi:predicted ATPase